MSDNAIQQLVGRAVVSDKFRARLLGAERADILRTSDLDPREQDALRAIPAATIEEFAAGVERVMRGWKQAANRIHGREPLPMPSLLPITAPRREG
jgi:hypothetical protein